MTEVRRYEVTFYCYERSREHPSGLGEFIEGKAISDCYAYTAEDAKFQVELMARGCPHVFIVVRVEPFTGKPLPRTEPVSANAPPNAPPLTTAPR